MSRFRPSPATVIATVALVVAASAGSAYAATQITGKDVKDGSLTGADIKDKSIHLADLAKDARVPGPAGKNGTNGTNGKDAPQDAIRPSFKGKNIPISFGSLQGTSCTRGTTTSLAPVPGGPSTNLYDGVLSVSPANSTATSYLALLDWSYYVSSANQFTVTVCPIGSGLAYSGVINFNYVAYPAG